MPVDDDRTAGQPEQPRRPGPTIDLKATEIPGDKHSGADAAGDSGADDPAPEEIGTAAAREQQEPRSANRTDGTTPRRLPIYAAGGLALAVAAALGYWIGGGSAPRDATQSELASRIYSLESEIAALKRAAGETTVPTQLSARVDDLAKQIGTLSEALRDVRGRADAAGAAAEAAHKATESAPPGAIPDADIAGLANRLTAIERAAQAREQELSQALAKIGDTAASRRAVAATALRGAVERGVPYAAELAVARSLATDPGALAPLEGFAASGIPSPNALSRELSVIVQAMQKDIGEGQRQGSILEKFQASAERLVRIRPLEETTGADAASVLARLELRAARSDLRGALDELQKLPPAVRAPTETWIGKVQARDAAIEASRSFAASALSALGKPAL